MNSRACRSRYWSRAILALLTALLLVGGAATLSGSASAIAPGDSCSAPAWNSGDWYLDGQVVSHNGHEWRAEGFVAAGMEPGNSGFPPWWTPWADLGPCSDPGDPGDPADSVEDFYAETGPWATTTETVNIPGAGQTIVFRPDGLGFMGAEHPIITWGNGAFQTSGVYSSILTHLASWGYVVLAPNTGQVDPSHMIAAAEWAVIQNGNGSAYSGKLDVDSIAALGHSRGSAGAVLTQTTTDGLITTSVSISTPDRIWWERGEENEVSELDSIFYVGGTDDFLAGQSDHQWFFNNSGGAAAVAAVVGGDHFEIQSNPSRKAGYITAWLKYKLEGDEFARQAFVGDPPQINGNGAWAWQNQKGLP